MDLLEQQTEAFLKSLYEGPLEYEPFGSSTSPDFILSGQIAIEVTRLVRPPEHKGGKSVDTKLRPVIDALRKEIESVRIDHYETSSLVHLDINKLPNRKTSAKKIRDFLISLSSAESPAVEGHKLVEGLNLDVVPSTKRHETPFRLGSVSGDLFCGWLMCELISQCEHAIERKKNKLDQLPSSISQVWLAVGSHLTNGLDDDDICDFVELFYVDSMFDKILLINGLNALESRIIDLH